MRILLAARSLFFLLVPATVAGYVPYRVLAGGLGAASGGRR